jgi:hypothetical protein
MRSSFGGEPALDSQSGLGAITVEQAWPVDGDCRLVTLLRLLVTIFIGLNHAAIIRPLRRFATSAVTITTIGTEIEELMRLKAIGYHLSR